MTIGIVIASYKYGHLSAHCIESIIAQTRKPDKIWFVDDGGGDCLHLPKLYPEINYVLRKTNLGIVDNFQDILNRVDTDYVMFVGADNWLRPDTLEILEQEIKDNDVIVYDILVTGKKRDEILNRHPREVSRYHGDYYWRRKGGHHGSMLYNVAKAKQVGGYKDGYGSRTLEDLSLYNRLEKKTHISEALLYYRRHDNNFNPC